MAQFANAVSTKARAMYGRMLTPAQYSELAHKQSVQEIASFLKERTAYATVLQNVQESAVHRGFLENLLRRDVLYQYVRLVKYAGQRDGIYGCIIMDIEIELILASLRRIISPIGEDAIATIPAFVQPYTSFDIFGLANAEKLDTLILLLEHSPYAQVMRDCRESHPEQKGSFPYQAYENALQGYYFETMLEHVQKSLHGQAAAELRELILMRAEVLNINALFRLKAYYQFDRAQMRDHLLPFYGKISRKEMTGLIEAKDLKSFRQLLDKTPYGREMEADDLFIERQTERVRFRFAHRLMRFSTNPQVIYVAFMLLRTIEVDNITRVIEGVRYQLTPEKIESLLCR